jgi:hypothetical protein
LRRHIRQACRYRQAAEKEISNFLDNIWSKEPDDVLPTIASTVGSSITVAIASDNDGMLHVNLSVAAIFGQDDLDEDETHNHHHPVSPSQALRPHVPAEDMEPITSTNYEYIKSFPSKYNASMGWKPTHGRLFNFNVIYQQQDRNNYAPFKDKNDWQVGHWLITNVSQTQANVFLELPIVSTRHHRDWACLNVSRFKANCSHHIRIIEPSLRRLTHC